MRNGFGRIGRIAHRPVMMGQLGTFINLSEDPITSPPPIQSNILISNLPFHPLSLPSEDAHYIHSFFTSMDPVHADILNVAFELALNPTVQRQVYEEACVLMDESHIRQIHLQDVSIEDEWEGFEDCDSWEYERREAFPLQCQCCGKPLGERDERTACFRVEDLYEGVESACEAHDPIPEPPADHKGNRGYPSVKKRKKSTALISKMVIGFVAIFVYLKHPLSTLQHVSQLLRSLVFHWLVPRHHHSSLQH